MKRGQVSMEFMLMVLMVILFTTVMSWAAYYYFTDYSEQRNIKRLQDLGYSLQNEVILAYNVEPGYVREVSVPETLGDYAVNISGNNLAGVSNDIVLEYKGTELLFRIPPVTGTFHTGDNTIRNIAGSVSIT